MGDCKEVISELIAAVRNEGREGDYREWWTQLDAYRTTYPLGYEEFEDGSLAPQYVMERLGAIVGPDAVYTAGVGQHQMWAAQFIGYENPGSFINFRRAARWASRSRPPWVPRWAAPTPPSGPSTVTVASR